MSGRDDQKKLIHLFQSLEWWDECHLDCPGVVVYNCITYEVNRFYVNVQSQPKLNSYISP